MILSIGIVNWNTRDRLERCLTSIEGEVNAAGRREVEACVVDNASHDGSAEMVREGFTWARLIQNRENLGFARAGNQIIRQTSGDHILLLNSDTELLSGAIKALLGFMEKHPRAGVCGPCLLHTDGSFQPSCHPMLTQRPWA